MLLPDGAVEHPRAPRRSRPPCRPWWRRASTRLARGCATSRAVPRCSSYSFDLRRARRRGRGDRPMSSGDLEEAEILVREVGSAGPARWRVRHATLREVAYASLPKRERLRLHERVADRLLADRPPLVRRRPPRARRVRLAGPGPAGPHAARARRRRPARRGDRARRRMESRTAVDHYRAVAGDVGPRGRDGVCARRGPSPAWARRATGSASTRRRATPSSARRRSRRSTTTRSRSRSRCGSSAISRSTSRPTSTRRKSCSTDPSPRPRSSASPWRSRGPCCSRAGCRGPAATTTDPEKVWRRALEVAEDDDRLGSRAGTHIALHQPSRR